MNNIKKRFQLYLSDPGKLPTNENHINFIWMEPGCKVLFSISQQGGGASCHFSSDKFGMKKINQAINEFCEFVFGNCDWCRMIFAKIQSKKIADIVLTCGFKYAFPLKYSELFIRSREDE